MRGGEVAKTMMGIPDRLLSVRDLSEMLQVPVGTIYHWRHRGQGPRSIRIGGHLRYDPADVVAWLAARKAASAIR
jgi:predicted DNA-binding transcriptional regulator AlpA